MGTVTSKDGTRIAFDQSGEGPAIILVVGAFNDQATGVPLSYIWKSGATVLSDGGRISGATTRELIISGIVLGTIGGLVGLYRITSRLNEK